MTRRGTFDGTWLAAALIAPQLLLVFVFFYWPAAQSLYWALTLEPPFGGGNQFVGWQNFSTILNDPLYWNSVRVSLLFAAASTTLTLVLSLMLAVAVDRRLTGWRTYRFVYFWPYAIAAPAVGLAFRFIFAPEAGLFAVVNTLVPNLWNPALKGWDAFILIVIANSWKMIAYSFIFFLAALQAIPRTIAEAAAMDGAGPLRRVFDVQVPLIAPTIFFLLVINITESFVDSFGIVDIMTGGGPARATDIMVFKIYSDGFKGLDYSLAAAQSIVLMGLVMTLTFIQFRYVERRVHYS